MKIEEGLDKDNIKCWFVLDGAHLIGIYYQKQGQSKSKKI